MEGGVTNETIPVMSTARNKSSPWGKSSVTVPCSLEEVMSEQLAADLQSKEGWPVLSRKSPVERKVTTLDEAVGGKDVTETDLLTGAEGGTSDEDLARRLQMEFDKEERQHSKKEETSSQTLEIDPQSDETEEGTSDEIIARMLQLEFDREHNKMLQREEDQLNKSNKVQISFDKYKTSHPVYEDDEDSDEEDYDYDVQEKTNWEKSPPVMGAKGYAGKGKNIVTKHDKTICGRRNADKMMMFPPGFGSGDGEGMDMQLPNHVYNKLKRHSQKEEKHSQKLHEKKEHSTAEHAVDPRTRLLLYKLINNNILASITGTISGGKESVVFHAYGGSIEGQELPKECAVKVFKTTLNEFKNREQYIHGDPRFFKEDFKKQNPRKIIKLWAHKEAYNLNRMKKFHVPCPFVVVQKQHVLVMSFIGEEGVSAPKLKDAHMSSADYEDAYMQVKNVMHKLYQECGLVHADLSEFNLLWHKDTVYVIDVSQAVDIVHFKAMEFLYRDCTNISKFFKKCGVHNVATPEALFNEVTELDFVGTGVDFLTQLQRYEKDRKVAMITHSNQHKEYAFDFHFDIAHQQRQHELENVESSDSDEVAD